ncbi:MAG: galactokinase [Verrucomicrobia bacterium]|nr:MAG: galactokinase [Verrucomicrobiota bacterium]
MIITRTPFRITLGGGGTDLPSFYQEHGGFVFAMTINKYMYLMLHRLPVTERKTIVRYTQVEYVNAPEEIQHPLAREALKLHNVREYVELASMADLPAKTGLGSSGAYLVGLLTAIRAYQRKPLDVAQIAEEACHIEMDILKEPVGKQDQYMAAYGGFQTLEITRDGRVTVSAVPVDFTTATELSHKARIYYTGIQRSATSVLKNQDTASRDKRSPEHNRVVESLCQIKEIGQQIKQAFLKHDLDTFGRLMDKHWQAKQKLSKNVSLNFLDELYARVKKEFDVLGGKVIGAGGGGFLMLYTPQRVRELDAFMVQQGLPPVSYFPAMQGAHVVSDLTVSDEFAS